MTALRSAERQRRIAADAYVVDKAELKKENERLHSEITCRKCKRTRVQTLFLPWRHLVACEEYVNSMDDCIIWSEKIRGTVWTFLIWRTCKIYPTVNVYRVGIFAESTDFVEAANFVLLLSLLLLLVCYTTK